MFVLLSSAVFVHGQIRYSTYTNPRFFFTIDYPSSLLRMQPPPINGDGRIFVSTDKTVEMRAWANYNATFLKLSEQFDQNLKSFGDGVTYKFLGDNKFVISGVKKGKIFYQETLYHKFKETDVFYTFTIEYPQSKRKIYDGVVQRIAKSFSFDPDADV